MGIATRERGKICPHIHSHIFLRDWRFRSGRVPWEICISNLQPTAQSPIIPQCFPSLVNRKEQGRKNHRSIPSGAKESGREQYPRHNNRRRNKAVSLAPSSRIASKNEGNRASHRASNSIERKARSSLPLPDSTHR